MSSIDSGKKRNQIFSENHFIVCKEFFSYFQLGLRYLFKYQYVSICMFDHEGITENYKLKHGHQF